MMAKATKLPSGSWTCCAYDAVLKKQIRFTAPTKREAEIKAGSYKHELSQEYPTFYDAAIEYIKTREMLGKSVRTTEGYKQNLSKHYGVLKDYPLDVITDKMIQDYINDLATRYAPKTVKNLSSLITCVYSKYMPSRTVRIELPHIPKAKMYLPSESDVRLLMANAPKELKSAIYLASLCTMRRGEITALDYDHINFKTNEIFIEHSLVQIKGEVIKKSPKTDGSTRKIIAPQAVIDVIKEYGLPDYTPNQLSKAFKKYADSLGLTEMHIHLLRHWGAAKLLSIPLPIAFVKSYGGWDSDEVLLKIYNYDIDEINKKSARLWADSVNTFVDST